MAMRLAGKNVILTGGSGGIGRFLAQGLAQEGASVSIVDLQDPNEAYQLAGPERLRFVRCDLADGDQIYAAASKLEQDIGACDIFVHCAAVFYHRPFEQIAFADWRRTMSVNFDALFHFTKALLPAMKHKGWGRIVSFASTMYNEGSPEHADYVGSKAALIGASRVLAKELGKYGITVNVLSPGLVKTAMSQRGVDEMIALGYPNYYDLYISQQSLKRTVVPEDIVGPLIFLVSDESAAVSGQTLIVDGGKEHS